MAKNQEKVTLTIDFNIERSKLQELSKILNVDVGSKLKGNTALAYFDTARSGVNELQKTVNKLYATLQKPLTSKNQAKELANGIQTAFEALDRKLLSLQGNIVNTFNSASNVTALKQIRQLGDEIDNLTADYKKAAQLLSEGRALGNKSALKSTLSTSQKELSILNKKGDNLTAEEIVRQKELLKIIEDTNAALARKLEISEQVAAIQAAHGATSQAGLGGIIQGKVDEQRGLIEGSISAQELTTLKELLQDVRKLLIDVKNTSNATVPAVGDNWDDVTYEARRAAEQAKTFKQVLMELGLPVFSLASIARGFREVARYSYDYVKNLDAALTEISIVSGKTRQDVLSLTDTFIELSSRTGMAIDDIAQASTIFYQQGLDDEAVAKMTEYTAMFAKISNETVEVAADQITAAINGFSMGVDQAGEVIDKLSVLAAYSAADIDELATAMSKAASQANMAGLSFDQYNAYLATMIETTREAPENIGTSLKTIMSRFQAIKTGDNTEDDTDVNAVEKALKSVGVSLRDEEGILRDLGDVLDELGPKWNSLNRNTQAYLGTVIAGTRQQSRFMSLMQNWDRAMELTEASQNSAGAATRMHAAAMEGLDASINNLTITWQKFISGIVNGNTFKGLIDTATGLLKLIQNGNSLLNIAAIAMVAWNVKTIATNLTLKKQGEEIRNVDTAFKGLGVVLQNMGHTLDTLGTKEMVQIQRIQNEKAAVDSLTTSYGYLNAARSGGTAPLMLPAGSAGTSTPNNPASPGTGKWSPKTFASNIGALMGKAQIAITAGILAATITSWIVDAIYETSEELREKAEKKYNKQQENIDSLTKVTQTVESSGHVYEELSAKVNKSAEEVEKLADAAQALGEAAPSAIVGYDSQGNPIIDTNKAKAAAQDAEGQIVKEATTQIGNISDLAMADIKETAEEKVNADAYDTGSTVAAGVAGVAFAAAMLIPGVNAAVLALAALSAVSAGVAAGLQSWKLDSIKEEELKLAKREADSIISSETGQKIIQNLSLITNAVVQDHEINGTTGAQREKTAGFLQEAWRDSYLQELYANSFKDGEWDKDTFQKGFDEMGTEWQRILVRIGDEGLAAATKGLEDLAVGLGDKTFAATEEAITKLITDDMGISSDDPLFKAIKQALLDAAYSGLGVGVQTIINDLETRKATAQSQGQDTTKYDTAINLVKNNLTNSQAGFYDSLGLTDNIDMMLLVLDQYGTEINNALVKSTEAASVETIAVLGNMKRQAEQKMKEIGAVNSAEYQYWEKLAKDAAKSIELAWAQMDISIDIPWAQLWEDLEKLTESANTTWEAFHALGEDGLDVKQWKEFTTALDKVDLSQLSDEDLGAYADGLNTVAANLEVVNGKITTNGKAMETLAELQSKAVQASINATKQELTNKKIELEANKAIVDAEIAALEYKIAEAKGSVDAEDKKKKAMEAWNTASEKINTVFVSNQGKVATAMVTAYTSAFSQIAAKFNQLQTGMADGKIDDSEIKKLNEEWKVLTENLNFDSYIGELDEKNYGLDELEALLKAAKTESKSLDTQIGNINLKLATLDAGLFTTADGTGKAGKSAKEYIGKLKEIYNILNRIQLLEHRRDMLDSYADIEEGKLYAQHMQERLDLNKELMNQYDFLVKEQKAFANGYADFIESSSLADVFGFDEFGQIIVDFEKYNALSTEAAEGQKSMKEQADELYEGYTEMYEDLMDYADDYLDTIKATIDGLQAVVDDYVEVEEKAADAIKEIYQDILDTKLEAIDKEIEALDDLKKAREEAREDQQNAKEVSGLQTNLQRAMFDTSGASDSAQIKARQDLNDKLDAMAEDKYSEMLDNLKTQLEDQKEMLQEEFDEMFENLEWLYVMLENNFMTDQGKLEDLWKQTDEWNLASPTRRKDLISDLDTKYNHYMTQLQGGKKISDVCSEIDDLQTATVNVETALKNQMINTGGQIAAAIRGMSTGGSGNTTTTNKTYTPGGDTQTEQVNLDGTGGSEVDLTGQGPDESSTPKLMEEGDKIEFRPEGDRLKQVTVYEESGNVKGVFKNNWLGDKNGIAGAIRIIKNQRMVFFEPADGFISTSHFQVPGGWGEQSTKKRYYLHGGLVDYTGPAWVDGSHSRPEAVLNALQTEHFIKFTNALDNMYGQMGGTANTNSIVIDTISFNVDSMSSAQDGEAAFDAFVNKFKEIGSQRGMKINNFKNIL